MAYEEIVCVHLQLKFLVFKNNENKENNLNNEYYIYLADTNDIEVENTSKEYFIKKLHKLLKQRVTKKNEYECILSGTISEVSNFLYQYIELFIEIKKRKYENEKETNSIENESSNIENENLTKKKLNKINLSKNDENLDFEENKIYFKCLFNDLINDFEFIENKKFENISNFYINEDLVLSICIKLQEYFIDKDDINKRKYNSINNIDKYDYKYKHILDIFDLKNLHYLHFNFDKYNKKFFLDNDIEINIGEMIQDISNKIRNNDENYFTNTNKENEEKENYSNNRKENKNENVDENFTSECHFSLVLIDDINELFDYFYLNDIYISFNNLKLNIDKENFLKNIENNDWIIYKNFKEMIFNLNTIKNHSHNIEINFNLSIISISLDENFNNIHFKNNSNIYIHYPNVINSHSIKSDDIQNNIQYIKNSNLTVQKNNNKNLSYKENEEGIKKIYISHKGNYNKYLNYHEDEYIKENLFNIKNNQIIKRDKLFCNIFLSVKNCIILELSNIYAEKKKKKQNFYIKIISTEPNKELISSLYLFQENKQIEIKNCYIDEDLNYKEEQLYDYFFSKIYYFDLSIKEEDNDINIGKGEFELKILLNDLKKILEENELDNYFQFEHNVPLYLKIFKEKYLTAELNIDIFLNIKEKKEEINENIITIDDSYKNKEDNKKIIDNSLNKRENVFIPMSEKTVYDNIPANIYEFKIWKENEENKIKESLKKKEENLIKKFTKKYEMIEKERKNEYELKKSELKEMLIKLKEEELNLINNKNVLKLKYKELNDEINSLDIKLKKIKYAYEKSLYKFKENLKKNNLNENFLKEHDELKTKYKQIIIENKKLIEDNEEMKTVLNQYNKKDNLIISNQYFENLKNELKELKYYKNFYLKKMKNKDDEKIHSFINDIIKNKKQFLNYIANFIKHLEDIYDLTNDEIFEDKFQTILNDINYMKNIINNELNNAKNIQNISASNLINESDNINLSNDNFIFSDIKYNKDTKCIQSLEDNLSSAEKNHNIKKMNTKTISKNVDKNIDDFPYKNKIGTENKIKTKNEKNKQNEKIAQNLKSEIKRLIETGIYNEDDKIIINMKKKLYKLSNDI